jgi:hypothetical protein
LCFSARSRVKGYLELYHAYIREPNAPRSGSADEESVPNEGEPGWEMIDPTPQQVESPSQVSTSYELCKLNNFF